MNEKNRTVVWGAILIVLGFFFLLQNFNLLGGLGDLVGTFVFGVLGVLGVGYYFTNRRHWWVLFPAFTFIGIAGSSFTNFVPFLRPLSGAVFLFSLSLAFWLIFLQKQPEHWWPAIPGGILTTLAFVDVADHFSGRAADSILMLGIAATFGLLWLLRRHTRNTDWALWVAIIALALAFISPFAVGAKLLFPLALIGVGGWMLLKTIRQNNTPSSGNDITIIPPPEA